MTASIQRGGLTSGLCHWMETESQFEVVQTDFNERLAQFSPDGKWIAYQSDKTGKFEIYIRPFPVPEATCWFPPMVAQARWNPNGKELFYVAADDRLMAVPIRFASNGQTVESGTPLALFTTDVGSTAINTNRQQYMVTPAGQVRAELRPGNKSAPRPSRSS